MEYIGVMTDPSNLWLHQFILSFSFSQYVYVSKLIMKVYQLTIEWMLCNALVMIVLWILCNDINNNNNVNLNGVLIHLWLYI